MEITAMKLTKTNISKRRKIEFRIKLLHYRRQIYTFYIDREWWKREYRGNAVIAVESELL